jgi:hypothetical protein
MGGALIIVSDAVSDMVWYDDMGCICADNVSEK